MGKATDFKFCTHISIGSIGTKAHEKFRKKVAVSNSQGVPKIFRAPMYRAHCAVIFAIAQLSCYSQVCIVCRRIANPLYTPCLKKLCKLIFCQNFVKFRPIVKIFGTKIAKSTRFSEVYSFATSPNLYQRTTVLNADVPNCYITLLLVCSKLFHSRSKFDKVLTKNKFA